MDYLAGNVQLVIAIFVNVIERKLNKFQCLCNKIILLLNIDK